MSKANIAQFIAATRSVMVPLTFETETERLTEEFKVIYKAFSPKVAEAMSQLEDEKKDDLPAVLAGIVVSIPEIESEGSPMEITTENLSQIDWKNLLQIYRSIMRDVSPTQAPATSTVSPVTSETEPAAQN